MEKAQQFNKDLEPIVKQALLSIAEDGGHLSLTTAVCRLLFQEPSPSEAAPVINDEIAPPVFNGGLEVVGGYPQYPLYKRLSLSMAYWIVTKSCPINDLPVMYMLNEGTSLPERKDKMDTIGTKLTGIDSLWDMWSEDEKKYTIFDIIKELDLRGALDLLGIRCTVGSAHILPPSQETLLATFNSLHSQAAKLTVGGRALSKHSHRGVENWWGGCTGTEEEKNKHALKLALRILKAATWINIHQLPHDVKVIEVRSEEGYGVRWRHDGSEFRGFLEPQMADGHSVGWKH